jgi:hypothetical protein
MGFANVFSKEAGLFSKDTPSIFSSISSQSGGAWFSTQCFYSRIVYNATVTSSPQELLDLALLWFESFQKLFTINLAPIDADEQDECVERLQTALSKNKPSLKPELAKALAQDYCVVVNQFGGDWANFVSKFLRAASVGYKDDEFADRLASAGNRTMQMASTDHYVQTTLAPNSRIRVEGIFKEDTGVFLGPKGDSSSIFSSPLTVQYSVSSTSTDSSP